MLHGAREQQTGPVDSRMFDVESLQLTESQRVAVTFGEGPLLVLAGPGSGKTRVMTERIVHLLRCGVDPDAILALTFTNKAADEMARRVTARANDVEVRISTFHRFCARLLREHAALVGLDERFTIYDKSDSSKAMATVARDELVQLVHFSIDRIAQEISWAKNHLITAEEYEARPGRPIGTIVAEIYPAYQRRLLACNAVDFDDLLLHVVTLLRENPTLRRDLDQRFRHILVDEYQDTNLAQYAIVRSLSNDAPNLCVTGDPDQSIYGWRGANLRNIMDFEKDYPKVHVVKLEQNYRSTKRILRVADALIKHNLQRKEKELFTENGDGVPVRLVVHANEQEEARAIAARIASAIRNGHRRPSDIAVFYRVNALSRVLEHSLRNEGIPYQIVNGVEFYERREIKDLIAYLRLVNNPNDDMAFLRVINNPPRGIGKKTLERLAEFARMNSLPLLEASRRLDSIPSIHKRARHSLVRFMELTDKLAAGATWPIEELVNLVIVESGYRRQYEEDDSPDAMERLANIDELVTAAREFDQRWAEETHLDGFLEQAALVNDVDAWDSETDRVTLMTLHAAKGLEFPLVYLVAVEQGLIPHERSKDNDEAMEEERRLLFVGITRARDELELSYTIRRAFRGATRRSIPSSFLLEIPREELDRISDDSQDGIDLAPRDDFGSDTSFDWESFDESVHHPDPPSDPAPAIDRSAASATSTSLMTAADLLGEDEDSDVTKNTDAFQPGVVVKHAQHGLGRIDAVSGEGKKRTAEVYFFSSHQRRSIRLHYSNLRIIGSGRD